jgi:predicted deacylase
MQPNYTKRIVAVVIIAVLGIGVYALVSSRKVTPVIPVPVEEVKKAGPEHTVIGQSVEGRDIDAYTYKSIHTGTSTETSANGAKRLLFVGGIHGGYEWNGVALAYAFMDYLAANPDVIPDNITLTVIPSINPDGIFAVTGKEGRFVPADVSTSSNVLAQARFNANKVDLNRNFDCKWQPKSTWQSKTVSAGTSAFSEPETEALHEFILNYSPDAVIFWHSQSNAVYASQCENGILPGTLAIMNAYSKASVYPAVKTFTAYATTGAADDWLASIGIPAITVELKTHDTIEWNRNLAGIRAVLQYFENKII